MVVLKRLADAERDGDRIYAVIRGTGVASDGRAAGLVNPDPGGQAHAVRQAWQAAGLDPARPGSIGLLEAHGTATPAGDAAELATLAEVFGPGADGDPAVIGSVKSMIGHTMPAAGVAGLVKAALAVHHGMLLPTLHCDDPHPALAATRFRPLETATPWETGPGQPIRRAAVNAFGFGGINAHVVLEQAPAVRATRTPDVRATRAPLRTATATATATASVAEPEQVLLLAADSPERLAALLEADDSALLAAGLDTGTGRTHPDAGRSRLGIVAPTAKRLALARRAVAKGRAWHGRRTSGSRRVRCSAAVGTGTVAASWPSSSQDSKATSNPKSTTSPSTSAFPASRGPPRTPRGRPGSRTWAATDSVSSASAGCSTVRCAAWASSRTRWPDTVSASGRRWWPQGCMPGTR